MIDSMISINDDFRFFHFENAQKATVELSTEAHREISRSSIRSINSFPIEFVHTIRQTFTARNLWYASAQTYKTNLSKYLDRAQKSSYDLIFRQKFCYWKVSMENFEILKVLGEGSYGQDRLSKWDRIFVNVIIYFFVVEDRNKVLHNLNKASLVQRKYDQKLFVIKEVKIRGMTDEEKKNAMKEVENLKKLRNLTKHIVE